MAKGEAKWRSMVQVRDALIVKQSGEIASLRGRMAELRASSAVCDRCVHRMCSECGISLVGRNGSAVTCGPVCRKRRERRLRSGSADITTEFGVTGGLA